MVSILESLMKHTARFWLALILCLLLTGCGAANKETTPHEVNGFTIDKAEQTITRDRDVYHYTISGSTVTIFYPDGSRYYWTYSDMGGYGGSSSDYDPIRYASGDTLLDVINYQPPRRTSGNFGAGLLLAAIGLLNLLAPRVSWYLSYGWRFRNAEPSDAALVLGRIGGGIVLFIGFLLIIF